MEGWYDIAYQVDFTNSDLVSPCSFSTGSHHIRIS